MSNMYEVLEKCLLEIEQGADVDTVLFRYPEFADELRPILETSIKAREMAAPEPASYVVQINRAKLLQHAAEMREAKVKPASRFWFVSLRRLTVTLVILLMMFVSGTGLVRAASNTIPGDNLYPVKRTWEDILLLFTFDPQERELLEFEHENERLEELFELFMEGRSVEVDFAGYVTRQSATEWRVSGITVIFSDQTKMPNQLVTIGDAVRVIGHTQSEKTVLAERIELLPPGSKLPEVEDNDSEHEEENHEEQTPQENENPNSDSGSESGSENEAPQGGEIQTPDSENESSEDNTSGTEYREGSIRGVLDSKNVNGIWMVSGQAVNVSNAEIEGKATIGATVKVEGYWGPNGTLIAKKVEVMSESSSGTVQNDDNDNSNNDNENDNHNDSDEEDND